MTVYDVKGEPIRCKGKSIATERRKDSLQELRELEGVKELRHVFGGVGCDKKRKSLRRKRPVLLDIKTNF